MLGPGAFWNTKSSGTPPESYWNAEIRPHIFSNEPRGPTEMQPRSPDSMCGDPSESPPRRDVAIPR